MAASISIIKLRGCLSQLGHSSDINMAMPMLIGVAMMMAMTAVTRVPVIMGQAWKRLLTGSQFESLVGAMKLKPNVVRASPEADQTDQPIATMMTRTKNAMAITMPCQAVSPWRHQVFRSNPL